MIESVAAMNTPVGAEGALEGQLRHQLVHVDKNLAIQGRPLDSNFAVPHGLLE